MVRVLKLVTPHQVRRAKRNNQLLLCEAPNRQDGGKFFFSIENIIKISMRSHYSYYLPSIPSSQRSHLIDFDPQFCRRRDLIRRKGIQHFQKELKDQQIVKFLNCSLYLVFTHFTHAIDLNLLSLNFRVKQGVQCQGKWYFEYK